MCVGRGKGSYPVTFWRSYRETIVRHVEERPGVASRQITPMQRADYDLGQAKTGHKSICTNSKADVVRLLPRRDLSLADRSRLSLCWGSLVPIQ